jgi:hypothetical protein
MDEHPFPEEPTRQPVVEAVTTVIHNPMDEQQMREIGEQGRKQAAAAVQLASEHRSTATAATTPETNQFEIVLKKIGALAKNNPLTSGAGLSLAMVNLAEALDYFVHGNTFFAALKILQALFTAGAGMIARDPKL